MGLIDCGTVQLLQTGAAAQLPVGDSQAPIPGLRSHLPPYLATKSRCCRACSPSSLPRLRTSRRVMCCWMAQSRPTSSCWLWMGWGRSASQTTRSAGWRLLQGSCRPAPAGWSVLTCTHPVVQPWHLSSCLAACPAGGGGGVTPAPLAQQHSTVKHRLCALPTDPRNLVRLGPTLAAGQPYSGRHHAVLRLHF